MIVPTLLYKAIVNEGFIPNGDSSTGVHFNYRCKPYTLTLNYRCSQKP